MMKSKNRKSENLATVNELCRKLRADPRTIGRIVAGMPSRKAGRWQQYRFADVAEILAEQRANRFGNAMLREELLNERVRKLKLEKDTLRQAVRASWHSFMPTSHA